MKNDAPLTTQEALARLQRNESLDGYTVAVTEPIDAVDAFHLRKAGIEVPDALITYADQDADTDDTEWRRLTPVNLTLHLPPEVAEWLATVPAERLTAQLVEQFYTAHNLVTRGPAL